MKTFSPIFLGIWAHNLLHWVLTPKFVKLAFFSFSKGFNDPHCRTKISIKINAQSNFMGIYTDRNKQAVHKIAQFILHFFQQPNSLIRLVIKILYKSSDCSFDQDHLMWHQINQFWLTLCYLLQTIQVVFSENIESVSFMPVSIKLLLG